MPPRKKTEFTPDELRLKKAELPSQLYRRNMLQTVGLSVEEGEEMNANTKILTKNLEILDLPQIDLQDPDAVHDRIREYFGIEAKWGFKPSVSGLANSLGMDRKRLWEIRTGNYGNTWGKTRNLPQKSIEHIRRAYDLMEQAWEDYMQHGKINPVAGIFLGKNLYGYQDKTEYVLTPNTEGPEYNEAEIRARLGLPDEGET